MKILILGGTGAIGTELVKVLLKKGHEMYVTSRSLHSEYGVTYIQENALEDDGLGNSLCISGRPDVIVDFMNYETENFIKRYNKLLKSCGHYIYLSSARVYAKSNERISENSGRLIDEIDDMTYVTSEEYAIKKARQEDVLKHSSYKNWTIIRPYITYNTERLQLGIYEKEDWLFRAMNGKKIVFSDDIAECITTLTYSGDVAERLCKVIEDNSTYGEIYNITNETPLKWREVIDLYDTVLKRELPQYNGYVCTRFIDSQYIEMSGKVYQLKYDRLYNRKFDNKKINTLCELYTYHNSSELARCLRDFVNGDREFRSVNWACQARLDSISGEHHPLSDIPKMHNRIKYIIIRYLPLGVTVYMKYKDVKEWLKKI